MSVVERIQQKMEQIEFWHEIEKGSKHFVKVVKTDDVLQILADFKIIPLEKWREFLKLWETRPVIEDLGDEVYATDLPKMKQWIEKIEEKLKELQNEYH